MNGFENGSVCVRKCTEMYRKGPERSEKVGKGVKRCKKVRKVEADLPKEWVRNSGTAFSFREILARGDHHAPKAGCSQDGTTNCQKEYWD